MLESLDHDTATIHELNLAGAFPERAAYRPRELYAALKASPLFDVERALWTMSEAGLLKGTHRDSRTQLLEVLAEAQFDPRRARDLYEQLKGTALYDPARGQWNWSMSVEQELRSSYRFASAQVLGVLVEAQFNPTRARELHEQLQATPLYDAARGQWNYLMSAEQLPPYGTFRDAAAELLGVLVEAQFNREHARVVYERLQSTPLYDPEHGQWNRSMSEEQILQDTDRTVDAQLLGVLVEAQLNPGAAQGRYEKLRTTPLYDPERGQWNWSMSDEQELFDTDRFAVAELLGVMVEAKLLAILPRALVETVPPLPVTEVW